MTARSAAARALDAFRAESCPPSERGALAVADARREGRASKSRAANASGRSLEHWLDEQHELARAVGLADLEHIHPRTTLVGGMLRYVARSGPDYRGVMRGGVAVAVEAKSAGRARLILAGDGGHGAAVKPHQAEALSRCIKLGGVALVVVRFVRRDEGRDVATTYAVPWDAVAGRATIGPDDVEAWAVEPQRLYLDRFVRRAP